ncbi:hypothetical protein QR680_000690 [Steinernema hermaphroditum]|uniref:Uncharacterized protein n=1 Tax=Steinernema hermaphroditum TaxID=289476 RepID=A0AA39GYB2_9BILA|nr:hypothetical protein QR680_000690 [Steinernema hermaphroditum]
MERAHEHLVTTAEFSRALLTNFGQSSFICATSYTPLWHTTRTEKFFQDKLCDMGLTELKKRLPTVRRQSNILERIDESTIVALREPLITISIFFIKECEKISIFVRTLLNKQHIAMMEDKFPQMLNNSDGSFAIHNFLFTENADTNYAALAKIAETISSVQAHQIKRIDIGCSALVAKISLLPTDPMLRVLANSGEGSSSVLFVVAVEAEGIC